MKIQSKAVKDHSLIIIDGLSVTYPGGHRALADIDLEINKGKMTVLLGSSGAGKSTLLRCINLLQKPSSGRIISDGKDISDSKKGLRNHRRQTAMVFQQHHLVGRHNVLQNVLMGRLGFHRSLRTVFPFSKTEVLLAMECLERVGMARHALKRSDQLSGGEQQRVGIARALVQNPKVILADEPVASLDPSTAESIMEVLYKISREDGITVLFSLHQLNLACRYGERIIGLYQGRIVFDGDPHNLNNADLKKIYKGYSMPDLNLMKTGAMHIKKQNEKEYESCVNEY